MVMSAYELNIFIFILARVPQIWSNYKASNGFLLCVKYVCWACLELCDLVLQAKDTGQLSLITSGMSTAGAAARIFTSIQEGAGSSMVRGFCIGDNSCLGCFKIFLESDL